MVFRTPHEATSITAKIKTSVGDLRLVWSICGKLVARLPGSFATVSTQSGCVSSNGLRHLEYGGRKSFDVCVFSGMQMRLTALAGQRQNCGYLVSRRWRFLLSSHRSLLANGLR